MNKNRKIYIAGHDGMVGSAIMRNLQQKGFNNIITRKYPDINLIRQEEVEAFFKAEKPDYVIDAAAKVGGILANDTYRGQFIYENLMIQNNLIHAAHENGVKKLLFLGSSCIYPKLAPQPMKEEYLLTDTLEETNEPYAIAKIAGIKMCENYYRQYGDNYVSVMPTNLYGFNDNFDLKNSHVLPALIRKAHLVKLMAEENWSLLADDLGLASADKKSILEELSKHGLSLPSTFYPLLPTSNSLPSMLLWGSGKPMREFLHVDDMADACVYILQNVDAQALYDEYKISHINIGTGEDITIADLARLIMKVVGYEGELSFDASKPDGTPRKLLDVSRLHAMGWNHKISLEEGIHKTYDWYLKAENVRK